MNSRDRRVRIRSQVWGIEVARYCVALYLIEEHGVVVSAPAFHRLKLLYHRNERAEVRKEDHIAGEVILKLIAKCGLAPQSIRAFSLMKTPSRDLSLRSFSVALLSTICHVKRQLPAYGRKGGEERHVLRLNLAVDGYDEENEK